jgi:cobalt/nickel transport system permease protein
MFSTLFESLPLGLHIPDGFLSAPVAIAWWILTIASVAVAVRRTSGTLNERQVPLMGVMAAFIFAAQMLNFPVLGGTSGHLLGGALAALLLGPWAGVLVMTAVIGLQALLFQDGGLLAMGANIFNMGVATALVGYGLGMPLLRAFGDRRWGLAIVGFIVAWASVMVAAILTSIQLALSGVPAGIVFPAMLFVHTFIGIGEGLITLAALSFVISTRPDIVSTLSGVVGAEGLNRRVSGGAVGAVTIVGLAFAFGAALISPLASGDPDGLERVAEDQGFLERAQDAPYNILPDYTIPGIDGGISTILSGVIGVVIVFALIYGLSQILRARRASKGEA